MRPAAATRSPGRLSIQHVIHNKMSFYWVPRGSKELFPEAVAGLPLDIPPSQKRPILALSHST